MNPSVGDVWSLSHEGVYQSMVVITRVRADYVTAIPLTADVPSTHELAAKFNGREFALWPYLDTGLGMFLLHERLGSLLTEDQVWEALRWAYDRDALTTLTRGTGERSITRTEALIDLFGRLCFLEE